MAITIRDVAEAAGVSTATVSRALRGLPNVDAGTRNHVRRVADSLDYAISPSASRLASGRTGSIAVVTPYIARWYFSSVLSGIEAAVQAADLDLLLICTPQEGSVGPSPAVRLRRRVDGVIAIAVDADSSLLHEIVALNLPTSLIGVEVAGTSSVSIDDFAAGQTATQHLINLGHTRIGALAGAPTGTRFRAEVDRQRGYHAALDTAGIPFDSSLEAHGFFTIEGGEQAMTRLLSLPVRPTAVFAFSDEMAFGAVRALRNHGLEPGRDITLVGIDGHELSEFMDLTTVAQPVVEMGQMAATALLDQLAEQEHDSESRQVEIPTRLIVRGSSRPLSA